MPVNEQDPLSLDSTALSADITEPVGETLEAVSQLDEAMKVLLSLAEEEELASDEALIRSLYEQAYQAHDEAGSPQLSSITNATREQIGQDVYRQVLTAVISEKQEKEGKA